ncbi:MAG: hypothetical protein RIS94_1004 [Pseudomonadota bacterium]|jgi:tetratricopeptide (TPR) repeat protein
MLLLALPLIAALPLNDRAMMQVGPNPSPQQSSPLPIPRRRVVIEAAPGSATTPPERQGGEAPASDKLSECLLRAQRDPAAGMAFARGWLAEGATPQARVRANHCLGVVLSQQGDFAGAEGAFADALAGIPPEQAVSGQGLLAMAGNAALAGGKADKAVDWFDRAVALGAQGDNAALGAMQADRARALVAAGRLADAAMALDEAHRLAPNDAQGWLLSATLARRNNDLPHAQKDIEVAASLDPRDPAIGLEAGVIAVLDGRDAGARKSWDSVVATAPQSDEAKTARGYLEQLGPAPTSAGETAGKPAS